MYKTSVKYPTVRRITKGTLTTPIELTKPPRVIVPNYAEYSCSLSPNEAFSVSVNSVGLNEYLHKHGQIPLI